MPVPPDLRHELTLLVLSRYPLVAVESAEEERTEALVALVARDLGLALYTWRASTGLGRLGGLSIPESRDPDRALAAVQELDGELLAIFYDLDPFWERPEIPRRLRDLERSFSGHRSTLVLAGVHVQVPAGAGLSVARLELALPDEDELLRLVRRTAAELTAQRRVEVDLTPQRESELARLLRGLDRGEASRLLRRAALADGRLDADDLPQILAAKRHRVRDAAAVEWVDPVAGMGEVGGAATFKEWIRRRSDAFSDRARRFGLDPPRGLLLAGVPGTGKSLACRAVAGEWGLPLLRLDPGRLYDKYVGASEANLRQALRVAEAMAPAVLWIDEIEKALSAGSGAADGGLSQRLLGALLTWMQERKAPVFLVATANDVEALPVELLRRGRFDEVFFFDLPAAAERERIFALHLEQRGRRPEHFELGTLAEAAEGFSGAEIEGVVVAGLYRAFSDSGELSTEVLLEELAATRPLSRLRPQAIDGLRAWGREHAVAA